MERHRKLKGVSSLSILFFRSKQLLRKKYSVKLSIIQNHEACRTRKCLRKKARPISEAEASLYLEAFRVLSLGKGYKNAIVTYH